jgi:hypothetical protein
LREVRDALLKIPARPGRFVAITHTLGHTITQGSAAALERS